jgi:hypothetical protein
MVIFLTASITFIVTVVLLALAFELYVNNDN